MSCCIQNHPLTPVHSCGADPSEAAKILEALGQFAAAAQALETAGRLPKWKNLRRCEGQHKWPEDMCYDPREQN